MRQHPFKKPFQEWYEQYRRAGNEPAGGMKLKTRLYQTLGMRGTVLPRSRDEVSHTAIGKWAKEVDGRLAEEEKRSDPVRQAQIRDLRVIKPSDVANLPTFEPDSRTHHYVRRLCIIHQAFYGRGMPVAAANAAGRFHEALRGLDPFAAMVLCLEFSIREEIVVDRRRRLEDIGEYEVAAQLNPVPRAALDLIAIRPWDDGSGIYTQLQSQGITAGLPSTPLLAPPLSNPRYYALQYWVLWRWTNASDLHLKVLPPDEWNWKKVMFRRPEDIPQELNQRVDEVQEALGTEKGRADEIYGE